MPEQISDDELAALALAADPDEPLPADAVPIAQVLWGTGEGEDGGETAGFVAPQLPLWYMPGAVAARRPRWQVGVVLAIVTTLIVLEALGLCSSFGSVVVG